MQPNNTRANRKKKELKLEDFPILLWLQYQFQQHEFDKPMIISLEIDLKKTFKYSGQ